MDMYEAVSRRAHARDLLPSRWRLSRSAGRECRKYKESRWHKGEDEAPATTGARARCWIFSKTSLTRFSAQCVDEYETLLTDNRIWKQRTVGIGVVSPEQALHGA